MADGFTGEIRARIRGGLSKALDGPRTARDPIDISQAFSLVAGTGADRANELWLDDRALAAATPEDLDLVGGSLVNAFGDTLNFAKVKALMLVNLTTDAEMQVEPAAANSWDELFLDVVKIKPGGLLLAVAPDANGFTISAGNDTITVTNNDGTNPLSYRILVLGEKS